MKHCGRCGLDKTREEFSKNRARKDGLASQCKACQSVSYQKWSDKTPESKNRHKEWKAKKLKENRALYVEYMKDKSCVDCGYSDWRALEFDHVTGEKSFGIAELMNRGVSWTRVLDEIAKCVIRCSNCHQIVTAERGNWWWQEYMTV